MQPNFVFLGAGNMAEALVAGLLACNRWPREHLVVTDVAAERRELFTKIDQLSAELVRRYRDGEANVDGLLAADDL